MTQSEKIIENLYAVLEQTSNELHLSRAEAQRLRETLWHEAKGIDCSEGCKGGFQNCTSCANAVRKVLGSEFLDLMSTSTASDRQALNPSQEASDDEEARKE